MEVKLPSDYPNVLPEIFLRPIKNVPGKVISSLEEKVREEAQSKLGNQMIFTLVSIVKEWLDEHNDDDEFAMPSDTKNGLPIYEELIVDKDGTPVTKETFTIWWEGYKAELAASKLARSVEELVTGKEFFARSGSTSLVAPAEGGDKAADIDWELFMEEGDGLDELEFDEDEEEEGDEDDGIVFKDVDDE